MLSREVRDFGVFDISDDFVRKYSNARAMFGEGRANLKKKAESFWILLAQILRESSSQFSRPDEPEYKFDGYDELLGALTSAGTGEAKKKIRAYLDFVSITLEFPTPDFVNKDFYLWFSTIAFPIFLNSGGLSEDDFKKFLQLFSSDLLLKIHAEATPLINTPLFVSLSSSTFSGAIARFCIVVDCFDPSDDRSKIYKIAVDFLMHLFSSEIFSEDLDVEVAILLRLLLSVRIVNRQYSEIAIKSRYGFPRLMSALFCSNFLLQALASPENNKDIFVDSEMIFDLLQGAMQENKGLCSQFNEAMRRNRAKIDISSLTIQACTQYFAMLDSDNQRCITWKEVKRVKQVFCMHNQRREAVVQHSFLDFVMSVFKHLAQPKKVVKKEKLFDFFCQPKNRSGRILVAETCLSYLALREILYGENALLKAYALTLDAYVASESQKPSRRPDEKSHTRRLLQIVPNADFWVGSRFWVGARRGASSIISEKPERHVHFADADLSMGSP